MKDQFGGRFKRCGWIFLVGLLLTLLIPAACSKQSSSGQVIKIDKLDTASAVTVTNGQTDWRSYTQKNSFPSGYSGEFFVMFSFSNILHNKNINVKTNVYIISDGILEDESSKYINQSDATDNTLFWGNQFDVSKYADGDYSVIVTVTDLMSGTSASMMNTFKIGGTS